METGLKTTDGKDVTVTSGSPHGSVSFTVSEQTFMLTADEARKLVKDLDKWLAPPPGPPSFERPSRAFATEPE